MAEQVKVTLEDIKAEVLKYVADNPVEMYYDYDWDDKLSEDNIKNIFKNTSSAEKIQDAVWSVENDINEYNMDYIDDCIDSMVENILEEHDIDKYDYENDDLEEGIRELVRENYIFNMNMDSLLSKSTVNVVATMHSNYDCLASNWSEERSGGYIYKESYFKDMIDFLNINPAEFKKKVIERNNSEIGQRCTTPRVQGSFPNLKHRTGKELISIESLLVELENNSSPSCFIFILEMTVDEAIELFKSKEKAKYLKVGAGTMCGIYSNWEGGGSFLECDVINPELKIKLKRSKYTEIDIDIEPNKHSHTVDSVYGMCRSAFKGGSLQLV